MKDWYLIKSPTSTMSGGYEDEALNGFKSDYFGELLDTELAVTVTLYNYDLSKQSEIRAVISNNTADTYLKAMNREILTPVGTLKAGDYIYYEDEYWLVVGRPGNNKVYEKAIMTLCQYELVWQREDGKVVRRWANFTSASKYDVGEFGNSFMYLGSNNFTIFMPNDTDAQTIDGRRVFIDVRSDPRRVFRITRTDDVLFEFHSHGGILSLIADRDEFNPKTDDPEIGICDYITPVESPETDVPGEVLYDLHITNKGNKSIVAGGNAKRFTVYALSSDGSEVDIRSLSWTLTPQDENRDYITYVINEDNSISIKAGYSKDIIGTQFLLTATVYHVSTSEYITIGGGI